MLKALDGRGSPTKELVMEVLSREYGWLPSEIRAERIDDIQSYLEIIKARNSLQKRNG